MLERLTRFARKPWKQKRETAAFFFRRGLARIPYLPIRIFVDVSPQERLWLNWSFVAPFYEPSASFFRYWGHDPDELQFLWNFLKPGMVFVDIGAHHGIFALVAAKRLRGAGRVIAFEPAPEHFGRMKLHLFLNGARNAIAEPLAVSSESAQGTFFQVVRGDKHRGSLRPQPQAGTARPISVETTSLDSYVRDAHVDRIDLIKMDVEGGELEALRGAAHVFQDLRPVLICEVLDMTTQEWGYDAREIILFLKAFDYDWFEFGSDGKLVPHEFQLHYPEIRNYIAVPREKSHAFLS